MLSSQGNLNCAKLQLYQASDPPVALCISIANVLDLSAEVSYLYGTSHASRVRGWLLVSNRTMYPLLIAFLID